MIILDDPREDGVLRQIFQAAPCFPIQMHQVVKIGNLQAKFPNVVKNSHHW